MKHVGKDLKLGDHDVWHEGNFDPGTKVDKVSGKQLSTEDYTTTEKNKLAGIAAGANNYTHPSTHSVSIISQDTNNRFVTDVEKSAWNGKAPGGYGLGTTCKSVSGDWNDHQVTGFYMGSGLSNQPPAINGSNSWWYVIVMQHNASPGWILQIATDFNNKATYRRAKVNGIWTGWTLLYTADNKPSPSDIGAAAASHSHAVGDLPDASTSAKGIVQLSTSTSSTSTILAATASAVKAAYDKGNHSHPYAPTSHTHTKSQITDMPTKLSAFENDIGAGAGLKILHGTTEPAGLVTGDWWYQEI